MKRNIFTFLIALLSFTTSYAQLQKGDWMLDLSGSLRIDNQDFLGDPHSLVWASFAPSAGKMLTDALMVGTGLGFYSGNGWSADAGNFPHYQYNISPFVRYYSIKKKKWAGFAFGELFFQHRRNGISVSGSTLGNPLPEGWAWHLGTGLGTNYFLAPNVAIEAKAGFRLVKGGDFDIFLFDRDQLYLRIGVNTFLHKRTTDDYDLMDRYLCKGNFIVSGEGHFQPNNRALIGSSLGEPPLERRKGYSVLLKPGIWTFVTDRLVVGGNAGLSRATSEGAHQSSAGLTANGKVYLPVGDRLFFVPGAALGYTHTVQKARQYSVLRFEEQVIGETPNGTPITGLVAVLDSSKVTTRQNTLQTDLSLQLNYFTHNRSILSGGMDMDFSTEIIGSSDNKRITLQAFAGYEHFFAENLSLATRFYFQLYDRGDIRLLDEGVRSGGVHFSLQYFIFRGKGGVSIAPLLRKYFSQFSKNANQIYK